MTQYFWPEQFRINDIALSLKKRGHKVTVLTGIPNYPEGEYFKGYKNFSPNKDLYEGIDIYRVPMFPRGKNKGLKLLLNYISFMLSASLFGPIFTKGKFEKIFVFQVSPVTAIFPGIIMKFVKKAKLYVWVLDIWPDTLEATGVLKSKKGLALVDYFVRFLYRHTDKILVPSKSFIERIKKQNVTERKLKYWPQWGEEFDSETSLIDVSDLPQGFVILFAGNIGTSQSFETVIDVATKLKSVKNLHWVIVGDGLKKKWLDQEVERRNLKHCFHLLGRRPISHMPNYYSYANVLLLSLNEGPVFALTIPGKTQSYLSAGRPILASIDGETARLIDEAHCGITCKASDVDSLLKGVQKLLKTDLEELQEMGKNARRCFDENFLKEKLLNHLEEIFGEV